jgi:hypothetical protein
MSRPISTTRINSANFDLDKYPTDANVAILSGYLTKEGGSWKSWKRRFFVLTAGGVLNYFEDDSLRKPKGSLDCSGALAVRPLPDLGPLYFEIDSSVVSTGSDRVLRACADTVDDYKAWVETFSILKQRSDKGQWAPPAVSDIYRKGFLTKEGGNWKTWKKRFFVLMKNGVMNYYEDETMTKLRGTLNCKDAEVHALPEMGELYFEILSDIFGDTAGRSLKLLSDNLDDMYNWIASVRAVSCMYGDHDPDLVLYKVRSSTSQQDDADLCEPLVKLLP